MAFEYRAVEGDELARMQEVDRIGFGAPVPPASRATTWHSAQLDRTRVAFEGSEMVGVSRAYSFELTMPGGGTVPAAAVSGVAVLPTHRRRGVLRGMIDALHADARAREEPVAILTASESSIYGRFGYGLATWGMSITLDRTRAGFARPVREQGTMRLVSEDDAKKLLPEVYERVRVSRAGMVSRPDYWWPEAYWSARPSETFFWVVHHNTDGTADGYASYSIQGDWQGGLVDRLLHVWELQATSAQTRIELWRYLCDVDLVSTIRTWTLPVDDPLRFVLAEPRRLRVNGVNDTMWVAPLDPAATLAQRSYASSGGLVIEVVHPGRNSVVALDGGPDGATCVTTTRTPDLTCTVSALGALVLGGNSWSTLRGAGLVEEHRTGAAASADAMFATAPAPAMLSWF